jgi:hypothetical protein
MKFSSLFLTVAFAVATTALASTANAQIKPKLTDIPKLDAPKVKDPVKNTVVVGKELNNERKTVINKLEEKTLGKNEKTKFDNLPKDGKAKLGAELKQGEKTLGSEAKQGEQKTIQQAKNLEPKNPLDKVKISEPKIKIKPKFP